MKTKYVRFNKLPRLETQNDHQSERVSSQANIRVNHIASAFSLKRSDANRQEELLEAIDNLMKKSVKPVRDFQVQARDRSVIVDLPDCEIDGQIDDDVLKEWLTDVCKNVFSSAFHSLSKDEMSYQHTKIFCSEGILRNIMMLTRKFRLKERQMKIIDDHIEDKIVSYMKRKYPMTESSDVSKSIDESVKPTDNREALQNDLLQKSDVVFSYRESGNYNDLIMKFINWMMTTIDEKVNNSSKTVYEEYYDYVSKLFENVYSQSWMNSRSLESNANLAESEKIKTQCNPEEYAAEVKEYTHYAIGRKISKNIPVYSNEEINSGHLTIKSPAILRILTKWCEQLWEKFTHKNYFLDREENVRVQEKDGNINTMFMWMKMPLNDMIEEEKVKIQHFMKEVEDNNYDQQAKLLLKQLQKDGFTHIEKIEKACGKFAYKTVNNLHCYITLYLNKIIHGLLTVSKDLYETKLSSKARWTSPPDLITFKIGDLMRCKCSSKEREILKIFQQLEHVSENDSKTLKIIRVKNRLKLGTNDILVNILYKEKYLCEIQLAVKSTTSKFIQCSNMFSHYIYELGRSLFGPLTELSSAWMSLDPRAIEYLHCIQNEVRQRPSQYSSCQKTKQEHNYAQLNRPFVCSNCNIAYSHTNFIWIHQKCLEETCEHMICARCRIQNESQQVLKQKLLEKESDQLKQACTYIVNRRSEHIPTYGVCIQIESKKIKIQKFKKLEVKKIMTIYGLKPNKYGEEKIILIDELMNKNSQKNFLKRYLVFQIPSDKGQKLINITIDQAKKDFIIPQKVKQIYKKEKEILSLIDQNIDDESCTIMLGSKDGMENIKNMELADNKLTNIKFITENFPKLQRLQLSRNKIKDIDTISKLNLLTKLNLRDNQLKFLPDQICELQLLEGLNIRNNQLTSLPENFGNLKLLNKLQSDNNKFTDLPQSFKLLKQLKFIDLSKNKLTKFPEAIKEFHKLKELSLSSNLLGQVPNWIENFKEMIKLDLGKTKLSNFPEGIFKLNNLQVLIIQTSYDTISDKIKNLIHLNELSLQMANLTSIPNELKYLINLQTLELIDCKVSVLPDFMSQMTKLITFSLINNNLDQLSNEITQMVRLKYLKIEGQNISSLPEDMKRLVNLRTLSLNNNHFKEVPSCVPYFRKLYSLSLKHNQIQSINENTFFNLPDIENLALDNNRLRALPLSIQNLKKLKKITYQGNRIDSDPVWLQLIAASVNFSLKLDESGLRKIDTVDLSKIK